MDVSKIEMFGTALNIKDSDARSSIGRLTNNISQLQGNVSQLQGNVSEITNSIKNIYDFSNIVIIGDSFTAGDGLTNPLYENWAAKFCDKVGAITKHIFGYGGIGFITRSSAAGGRNLPEAILYAAESVPDKNGVKCVIVQGGRNDAVQSYGDGYSSANSFVQNCKSVFPNAKIIALYDLNYDIVDRNRHNGGAAAFSDNGCMCTYNAYTWLPFREDILQADHIHPTAYGANLIANWFLQDIMGGEWGYTKAISGSGFSGWVNISNGQMELVLEGNETRNGPDVTLGNFPSGTYFTNYAAFPVWRDNVSPCYLYFINKEMHLQTPGKAEAIGFWRARINVAFPMYQ